MLRHLRVTNFAILSDVTVEQIADMTVFLCGESGASVNGAVLAVDGGWTAA